MRGERRRERQRKKDNGGAIDNIVKHKINVRSFDKDVANFWIFI